MKAWVAANNASVNIRGDSSTDAPKVGRLSNLGVLAELTGKMQAEDEYVWHEIRFSQGLTGWCRDDIFAYATLKPASLHLDVPYRNQNRPGADNHPNDCGPACVAMLVDYHTDYAVTVNDVARSAGMRGNAFTNFNQLIKATQKYKLEAEHQNDATLPWIIQQLKSGTPIIALVNYGQMRPGKVYGHFVVVIGYELHKDGLFIRLHDPNDEANMRYPADMFANAIGKTGPTGNMPFQSLVVQPDALTRRLNALEARIAALEAALAAKHNTQLR